MRLTGRPKRRLEGASLELKGTLVLLRSKRLEDAEADYKWRTDPEVAALDAALPLTMSFQSYLRIFREQLARPTPGSDHFGIEALDGTYIGNCMYYDLDSVNKQAELGIVIGDRDYWSHGYGYDSVTLLLDHMFIAGALQRVYLHTLEWNERAQKCFGKCGFVPVKTVRRTGYVFLQMEIHRADWEKLYEERRQGTEVP